MERIPEFIANHLFLCSLFVALFTLLLWQLFGDSLSGVKGVSTSEMTHLINRENALVLDIRSEEDFKNGYIINAKNIPHSELEDSLKKMQKHKNDSIVLYCQNGSDSSRVIRAVKQSGFEKVCFLKGGMLSWQNANLPIAKK